MALITACDYRSRSSRKVDCREDVGANSPRWLYLHMTLQRLINNLREPILSRMCYNLIFRASSIVQHRDLSSTLDDII